LLVFPCGVCHDEGSFRHLICHHCVVHGGQPVLLN
jgi:hypothetical protein